MSRVTLNMILVGIVGVAFIVAGTSVLSGVGAKIYTPIFIDETNAYSEMQFYYEILMNLVLGVASVLSVIFGLAILFSTYRDFTKIIEARRNIRYYSLKTSIEAINADNIFKAG